MSREVEMVGRDTGGVTYRLRGGRATVCVHEKSAADIQPGLLEKQLEAAEARLAQDERANADVGERTYIHGAVRRDGSGLADLTVDATSGSIVLRRGDRKFVVFDHELPAVYEAARRRWADSFEKKKADALAEIKRFADQLEAARDRLARLKEEDGGLHLARGDS